MSVLHLPCRRSNDFVLCWTANDYRMFLCSLDHRRIVSLHHHSSRLYASIEIGLFFFFFFFFFCSSHSSLKQIQSISFFFLWQLCRGRRRRGERERETLFYVLCWWESLSDMQWRADRHIASINADFSLSHIFVDEETRRKTNSTTIVEKGLNITTGTMNMSTLLSAWFQAAKNLCQCSLTFSSNHRLMSG